MDEDASSDDTEWNDFVVRNRRRVRLQPLDVGPNADEQYTLKDTDMLWEIGCKVCYSVFRIIFTVFTMYRMDWSTKQYTR